MMFPTPFIYISALMRTGSTMLSEALTQMPQSFIFLEPYWGLNSFSVGAPIHERLLLHGINMRQFLRLRGTLAFLIRRLRPLGIGQDFMIREVKRSLFPQLRSIGMQQVGVKEIKHKGWQNYVRHFPDMKVVMLGRDPRDLYLSAYRKLQLGSTAWQGPVNPETVAENLSTFFSRQLRLRDNADHITVRYEDLCTDPAIMGKILSFCQSPLENVGDIGQFLRSDPIRDREHQRHGATISDQSVYRWQGEQNQTLLEDAFQFARLMHEYTSFWGYDVQA